MFRQQLEREIDFNPPMVRISSHTTYSKGVSTAVQNFELTLKLITLDIKAFETSIFKVRVRSKDQTLDGKFTAFTKNKYKIEAPPSHSTEKGFAAELEFHNEKITKVVSFRKLLVTDIMAEMFDSPYEPYFITIDILNGNKVYKSVELNLNKYVDLDMQRESI